MGSRVVLWFASNLIRLECSIFRSFVKVSCRHLTVSLETITRFLVTITSWLPRFVCYSFTMIYSASSAEKYAINSSAHKAESQLEKK